MKAIILVGGFGTRLQPLTLSTPKQMLPIADVPQLERKIAHLVSFGITDIVLSLGYKPDAFSDAYPDNSCAGARLTYVVEDEPLGTAGAIAFAARSAGIQETFLAMNGDVLTDLNIEALLRFHRDNRAEGTIALTPVDDPSRFGVVVTDDSGKVSAFVEKPKREEVSTNLINAGTYVLEPTFLNRVPTEVMVSIERETFPAIVADGKLYAGSFSKYFLDIGTPDAFIQANLDIVDQQFGGWSYLGQDAKVADGATVEHSVISTGAKILTGAVVRDSVILADATIEEGAIIEHSIVGPGATVGKRAQLYDTSVIGAMLTVDENAVLRAQKVNPN